jgi:hypothetical protein
MPLVALCCGITIGTSISLSHWHPRRIGSASGEGRAVGATTAGILSSAWGNPWVRMGVGRLLPGRRFP